MKVTRMKIGFWLWPEFYNTNGNKGVYFLWWHFTNWKNLGTAEVQFPNKKK